MADKVTYLDYLAQLQALLPKGPAWPQESDALLTKLLTANAAEFARVHNRCFDLLREMNPLFSLEMLTDWERVCGLPDDCYASSDSLTIQERRSAVLNQLNARGGQSLAYFQGLATAYGYDVEIEEFRPFMGGLSRCGELVYANGSVRFNWRVRVNGSRVTQFRAGQSLAGDSLYKLTRAEDLECLLNRLKPAHTNLIFEYPVDIPPLKIAWFRAGKSTVGTALFELVAANDPE